MDREASGKLADKEGLKKLREARKQSIDRAIARVKEQKREIDSIEKELEKGGKTVPEIAAATGISSSSVMWYVAALKKYGRVVEGEARGNYFEYRLANAGAGPEPGDEAADESVH